MALEKAGSPARSATALLFEDTFTGFGVGFGDSAILQTYSETTPASRRYGADGHGSLRWWREP